MQEVQFAHVTAEDSDCGLIKGLEYHFNGVEEAIRAWIEGGWEILRLYPLSHPGGQRGDPDHLSGVPAG